jgi:hypothetical protein
MSVCLADDTAYDLTKKYVEGKVFVGFNLDAIKQLGSIVFDVANSRIGRMHLHLFSRIGAEQVEREFVRLDDFS